MIYMQRASNIYLLLFMYPLISVLTGCGDHEVVRMNISDRGYVITYRRIINSIDVGQVREETLSLVGKKTFLLSWQ
jgi:hypothetical protein